jgi:hypothetical protein
MSDNFGCKSVDGNADGLNVESLVQVGSGGQKVINCVLSSGNVFFHLFRMFGPPISYLTA